MNPVSSGPAPMSGVTSSAMSGATGDPLPTRKRKRVEEVAETLIRLATPPSAAAAAAALPMPEAPPSASASSDPTNQAKRPRRAAAKAADPVFVKPEGPEEEGIARAIRAKYSGESSKLLHMPTPGFRDGANDQALEDKIALIIESHCLKHRLTKRPDEALTEKILARLKASVATAVPSSDGTYRKLSGFTTFFLKNIPKGLSKKPEIWLYETVKNLKESNEGGGGGGAVSGNRRRASSRPSRQFAAPKRSSLRIANASRPLPAAAASAASGGGGGMSAAASEPTPAAAAQPSAPPKKAPAAAASSAASGGGGSSNAAAEAVPASRSPSPDGSSSVMSDDTYYSSSGSDSDCSSCDAHHEMAKMSNKMDAMEREIAHLRAAAAPAPALPLQLAIPPVPPDAVQTLANLNSAIAAATASLLRPPAMSAAPSIPFPFALHPLLMMPPLMVPPIPAAQPYAPHMLPLGFNPFAIPLSAEAITIAAAAAAMAQAPQVAAAAAAQPSTGAATTAPSAAPARSDSGSDMDIG